MTSKWNRSVSALAVAAGAAVMGLSTSAARAAEPSQQELLDQVRLLQSKVADLEAKQQAPAAAAGSVDAALVDRAIADVRRDADQRSQFLQANPFNAGYLGGKFLIQSDDGKFVLNPNLQAQFRYIANYRQESKNIEADDAQSGFELRRLKLAFDGNLFTKQLTYRFQWNTGRTNGNPTLDEAWVKYAFEGTGFAVRLGTFPNAWDKETAVSSKRQLAVERSALHEILQGGATNSESYVQGIEGIYDDGGPLRAFVGYNDGFSSRNTNFTDTGGGSPALGLNNPQWAVSGRVEYKLSGDWKNSEDFTALATKQDLLVVGAGGDVDAANNLTAYFHTVDVQWEPAAVKGLSVFGAYVGVLRDFRTVGAGIEGNPYDWGFVAQAGYLLDAKGEWEVYGRYSFTSLDDGAPTGTGTLGAAARVEDSIHELTVGVNYYLRGHAAKFTVDATYLPNGSPLDLNGAGILAQPDDESQFVIRAQFQLLL